MRFTVFTVDGRATQFFDQPSSTFIVQWKAALLDPAAQWPYAYLKSEEGSEAIHFAPHAITAVAVAQ